MILRTFSLMLSLGLMLSAGQPTPAIHSFSGKVVDESSNPLTGAGVLVKGTTQGTVTDANGEYRFDHAAEKATLVISYTGYVAKTVRARAGEQLTVQLFPEIQKAEEAIALEELREDIRPAERAGRGDLPFSANKAMPPGAPAIMGHTFVSGEPGYNFNTEDYGVINENRFYEVTKEPLSTFSIDVDAASYSNIRRFIRNGQRPVKDAVRIEEMINYFDYDYPEPKGEHPFSLSTEIGECPWQPEHRLLHVGLQAAHLPMDDLPASNLVFLIDVSGSMDEPNKLPLLQSSFKLLVDQLRAQDRVAIVVYAGAAGQVLPPTNGSEKEKIKDAIAGLHAGGSTAGAAGIELAYRLAKENFVKGGNNRVILATDGDFNVGTSSDAELVRMIEKERESGVFLTVLGFGMGNYKDNKMQQLADYGNGNHAYIDDIGEARKVLVSEFGGTMFAVAKDVKIQIEFNPARVRGYRLIGYENRVLANEDFNDDKKDAGELGSGHTVTALYEIIPAGVESKYLAKVDELKYQTVQPDLKASHSKDWVTVKLRYKEPDGTDSRLMEKAAGGDDSRLERTSDNFRWSAAVAEFGMLLRDSEYRGKAGYLHCRSLAEGAKGRDPNGYRSEFIELIDKMKNLADPETAGKEKE